MRTGFAGSAGDCATVPARDCISVNGVCWYEDRARCVRAVSPIDCPELHLRSLEIVLEFFGKEDLDFG